MQTGITITRQLGQYIVGYKGRIVASTRLEAVAKLIARQLSDCIVYGEDYFINEVVEAKQQVLTAKALNGHYNTDDNKDFVQHM